MSEKTHGQIRQEVREETLNEIADWLFEQAENTKKVSEEWSKVARDKEMTVANALHVAGAIIRKFDLHKI